MSPKCLIDSIILWQNFHIFGLKWIVKVSYLWRNVENLIPIFKMKWRIPVKLKHTFVRNLLSIYLTDFSSSIRNTWSNFLFSDIFIILVTKKKGTEKEKWVNLLLQTDTASVLLEAIGYIRFLQGQIQVIFSFYFILFFILFFFKKRKMFCFVDI